MPRRSNVAVILPTFFAAFVSGLVLIAVVLEGPITVIEPESLPSGEPSSRPHRGSSIVFAVGQPWNWGFLFLWLALGLLVGGPFNLHGTPLLDWYWTCAKFVSPFINVFVLHIAGRGVDRAIERRRMRSTETQP